MSWIQPWSSVPSSWSASTWQSVKKTSLTILPPIVSIGRISTPSASRGTVSIVMPSCLEPLESVRQTSRMCSARCASEIHVFWPLTT